MRNILVHGHFHIDTDIVWDAATRDVPAIKPAVDYALFTVQPDWALERPCRCGAPDCRRKITGKDWRLPRVKERYHPHFSPFMNRRIDRLRGRRS